MRHARIEIVERQQQNEETALKGLLSDSGYIAHPDGLLEVENSVSDTVDTGRICHLLTENFIKNLKKNIEFYIGLAAVW